MIFLEVEEENGEAGVVTEVATDFFVVRGEGSPVAFYFDFLILRLFCYY